MKKIISLTIVVIMLMTSISFAAPSPDVLLSFKELNEINNDIGIVIRNILTCGYDAEDELKTLTYNRSRVKQILGRSYPDYGESGNELLENRETITIIYIASLYALCINGLSIYIEQPDKNEKFLLNAITEYNHASISLKEFKSLLKKLGN